MRRLFAALALALVLPLALAAAQTGAGGAHEDPRFGFRFKPPRKWSNIAIQTDEGWLAAKYLSDKTYFYTDEDTRWTTEHTPELLVIAFIEENMKRTKEVEEKTKDGVTEKRIKINNPYKDYEDFLDRTYSGGGFYVDAKERTEIGGIPVTQYTIKVEKLSRNGPKRILTWIWHTPGIDFAMQVEVLEGEYKKLKRTIESSFKSFEQIERTEGSLPTNADTLDSRWITFREMDEGDPKERRTKRMDSQRALHERAIRGLPEDWDHFDAGGVLVLSHTDQKYAKRVGDHAKAFLKWLGDTFPYVGEGEYVRAPIVRICSDREEEGAYSRGVQSGGGGWWLAGSGEIVTHKDDTGWIGWEMDWVNQRLFDQWLQDRDRELSMAMPEWLRSGLRDYVEGARAKGRKIDFRVDEWNRDETRLAVAQGSAASPRELIRMTSHELWESGGDVFWSHRQQSAMFVRYLMSNEARRTRQARDLVEEYIKALDAIIDEELAERREDFKDEGTPQTEEEEAELARKRAERWKKEEDRLMDKIFQRVFGDWSDSDWESLERGYSDFIS